MQPIDPKRMFSNRIDWLKKTIWGANPWGHNPDPETYDRDGFGTLRRKFPKHPSKYAFRKNTKRARKWAEVQHEQVAE